MIIVFQGQGQGIFLQGEKSAVGIFVCVPLLYELWGFCEVNNKSQNVQLMLIEMHNFTGLRQTRGHIPWDES